MIDTTTKNNYLTEIHIYKNKFHKEPSFDEKVKIYIAAFVLSYYSKIVESVVAESKRYSYRCTDGTMGTVYIDTIHRAVRELAKYE